MGLWFEGSCRSVVPLGSRQMCALFISLGMSAVSQMCSMSFVVICSVICPPWRISSIVIPSGPGAFLFGMSLIVCLILALSGVMPDVRDAASCGGWSSWYIPFQNCMKDLVSCPLSSIYFCPRRSMHRLIFLDNSHIFSRVAMIYSTRRWSRWIPLNSYFFPLVFSVLVVALLLRYGCLLEVSIV